MKSWKNKKVLVTGAGGFIGKHMVTELYKKGALVTAVYSKKNIVVEGRRGVRVLQGDIMENGFSTRIAENQEAIFHFAALDGGKIFKKNNAAEIYYKNTNLTANILEAARKKKVKNILLMSSIEVYQAAKSNSVNELTKLEYDFGSHEGYAWSKISSELMARLYAGQYGMNIGVVRAGNIYGSGDDDGLKKGRVIPVMFEKSLSNKDINLWGNGSQQRSFLYIDDFVESAINMIDRYPGVDPVNILSSEMIKIRELARMIIKKTGSKSRIVYSPSPVSVLKDVKISNLRARKMRIMTEKISLQEGLERIFNEKKRK